MPDLWMDVDVALAKVPVNLLPLLDDTDFKAIEAAIAYNAAGMALFWHFVTPAGAYTVTAVTPTTGGDYDWTDQGDAGIYTIEIPASGGASINNDTEGFGWFTGKATGVLPWRGPVIGFRAAGLNNLLIENAFSTTRALAGTALPDAAADAAGGLPISDAGGLDLDTYIKRIEASITAAILARIDENISAAKTLTSAYDPAKTAAQASDIPAADITAIKTVVESATYGLSALKTLIDAIKAKSDLIPADIATALGKLDTTITSRMASFSYTAPANADIAAIKVITDYLAAMLETDGAVKRYTANALEQAPSGSVTAPTVEEIRAEMDSNSTKLASINGKVANLPADPADESSLEAAITAAHAATDALISAITGGGLTEKTYTLTDASTHLPLAGVQVWATTDEAGLNQVDITRTTNDAGQVTFRFNLAAGTPIYIWNRYMAEGDAPDEEEI